MTKPEISGIATLFIVNHVPAALAFYRDRLGFEITFQGPELDDIFFGVVRRGAAMIMFKAVGVDPVPNYTRDVQKGIAAGTPTSMSPIRTRWRQSSRRGMSSFLNHSKIPMMACVDSNSRTLTATFCFLVVLVHERQFKLGFDLASQCGAVHDGGRSTPRETRPECCWSASKMLRSSGG
jgi:hypothetical protein